MFNLVRAAIAEDVGRGDLTSLACLEPDPFKAHVVAKCDGVLSGMEPALATFDIIDSANSIEPLLHDGDRFDTGNIILRIRGFNQTVLASERIALNFLAHLSGIATLTAKFVDALAGTRCRVLDTRKTTPGWRMLEKRAVQHGGGVNHRAGLYDMILIKDNHIAASGSIASAVLRARDYMTTPDFRLQFDKSPEEILIQVEVTSADELREAIDAGVDRVLLDNQTPDSLHNLVQLARGLNPSVLLEASGNITLHNASQVAATGVDFISVGALTHSAPACDFSLRADAS